VDDCVYTDANAQTISAYVKGWRVLGRPDCRERALKALDTVWEHCHSARGGMHHYFDGAPHVPGLLIDQVLVGRALLDAHGVSGEPRYLERARELGEFVLGSFANPAGGFYDINGEGPAHLQFRMTLLTENGFAAAFFLHLADATKEERYRQAALWALYASLGDLAPYGVHAAGYARALAAYLERPVAVQSFGFAKSGNTELTDP
jgi:uncharacterized protein YyaL (SSP411 family)